MFRENTNNEPVIINIPRNDNDIETQTDDPNLKRDIYDNIIYDYIKKEVSELLIWEKRWKTISLLFTILKYICLVSVPILSLSSPYFIYQTDLLAYLSGALSSMGLGFERLAKLADTISTKKQDKANIFLNKLHINFKLVDSELKTAGSSVYDLTSPKSKNLQK